MCIVTCDTLYCDIFPHPIWQRPRCHHVIMIIRFRILPVSMSHLVLKLSLDVAFLMLVARRRRKFGFGPFVNRCPSLAFGRLTHRLASLLLRLRILGHLGRFGNERRLGCCRIFRGDSFSWISTLHVLHPTIQELHGKEELLRLASVTRHRHHTFVFLIEDI